jgi:hypothetical protein
MVLGTFFKTGFEKGLTSHESVVKNVLPLLLKTKNSYWPLSFAFNGSALPRQAGTALNNRLKLTGKNRRVCIPTSSTPAIDIAQHRNGTTSTEDSDCQIFISLSQAQDVAPAHSESVQQKWREALDAVNATATTFNNAFEIANESLSKETMHRLAIPAALKEGCLFSHDGALGSDSADDIKYTVVTHDPTAALYLKHMANPTPQVDPVHFPNLFSVYHVHDYAFATPRIIEEFGGVSEKELGLTTPQFVMYDLAERTVFVSGSTRTLKDAILCMGGLVAFHVYGSLTMACNSFVDSSGKLVVVFGGKAPLSSPSLYGAHHNLWTKNGISRAWNGVTTDSPAAPQFATDLVESTGKATYCTAPLPLQMGGKVRPRGSNALIGADSETLEIDPALAWRPNVVSTEGARFVFVGGGDKSLTVQEAAKLFADSHAAYPTGFTNKKNLAAKFEELAATAKGAAFSSVSNIDSLQL